MSYIQLQFRRDLAANWTANNPTLAAGEFGLETNTSQFKIGDGSTPWNSLSYGGLVGPAGSTTTHTGVATMNFGSVPGTNIVSTVVSGQTGILTTTTIEFAMMGTDSTATHNTTEHSLVPLNLTCIAISAGSSFTLKATTEFRLTGTFLVRWTWLN